MDKLGRKNVQENPRPVLLSRFGGLLLLLRLDDINVAAGPWLRCCCWLSVCFSAFFPMRIAPFLPFPSHAPLAPGDNQFVYQAGMEKLDAELSLARTLTFFLRPITNFALGSEAEKK